MNLRSQELRKRGYEIDALRMGMKFTEQDLDKTQILIDSSYGTSHPGSIHLNELVEEARLGVKESEATPSTFYVTDICDGIAQGHEGMNYSLLSRELMAGMVEVHVLANPFDGIVLCSSCDKSVPAHLIAAARIDLPTIHVPGGTMAAGPNHLTLEQIGTFGALLARGEITKEEFITHQKNACPSCGACQFMGTASTMQVMAEALGLALPGTALTPASLQAVKDNSRRAGIQIVELVKEDIRPSKIMTEKAFENALIIHAAVGGSSNAFLHMPAIARELGIKLDLDIINEINNKIPYLVDVRPSGRYAAEYFWYAGGVPALMLALKEHLNLDVLTVTGKTLGENLEDLIKEGFIEKNQEFLKKFNVEPDQVIRPLGNPIQPQGAMVILKGNLAPDGAVVKQSAVVAEMRQHVGPARPFDTEEDAQDAILKRKIKPGDVVIIRYEGPKGSGMPEMFYTTEALASDPELISTTAIVTDGRFSGATRGPAIGHVSPEASEGGPLALVEDGDLISIDIPNKALNVVGVKGQRLSLEEVNKILTERKKNWQRPNIKHKGILSVYSLLAASPMDGAYMDPENK